MKKHLYCLLGDELLAETYCDDALSWHDRQRIAQSPRLSERIDWKVSRALKQKAKHPIVSLSHSHGIAAVLCTPNNLSAGVDVEKIRPRDFQALAEWVCTEREQEYLAFVNWDKEEFYRLWCIKEALLKAADLNFPEDMRKVGYRFVADGKKEIQVCGCSDWHGVTTLLSNGCAVACVWQGSNVELHLQCYGDIGKDD
ncbi:4'-phosphopantetheinyl transferase superfamily protein [Neisseria sp. HMSC064E01]|jgi:4'-phosphopantetheinyl transferase family protein|uniref:4'-phosphopantetheinyl transferase family protein n=1 Tax=Neisseria sp. HMSC064E01 TaxID=1715052 RepID=UPI0008A19DFB|nr:4'-phosphopantetheinyl transferase superfamily protein [Neisseria sp. HMSC064E01]OFN80787.1 4'-phosphopantetheinyl transferase [Neisseria sp. HMSC064E01]